MVGKLRFAIVGLHNWYHAYPYAMSFKHIPDIELVAVSHDNPVQLKEFSTRFGIKENSVNMEEVIGRKDVDAVIVTAYTAAHLDLVKTACEEGKHVLCDKPIEVSLKRTREMIKHVEKARVKFRIGHEFRTLPTFGKVVQLVKDGAIGEVVSFSHSIHAPLPRSWMTNEEPGWYGDPEKVGHGGFFDFSVQQFDVLRFILEKEGTKVTGSIRNLLHKDLAVEDYGVAFLEFEGGISGIVESSWIIKHPGQFTESFSLRGTGGNIVLDGQKIMVSGKILKNVIGKTEINMQPVVNELFRAVPSVIEIPIGIWYHLLSDFTDSILEDKAPPQNIYDGLRSLELAMATYESSKRQKPVSINELSENSS